MKGTKRKTKQDGPSPSKRPKTSERSKSPRKSPRKKPPTSEESKSPRKSPRKQPKTSEENKNLSKSQGKRPKPSEQSTSLSKSPRKRPKPSEQSKGQSQFGKQKKTTQTSMEAFVQRKTIKSKGSGSANVQLKQKTAKQSSSGTTVAANKSAPMPNTYPDIDNQKTFDDRFDLLYDEIVVDCHAWEVGGGFQCYIEENVGDDWQAVWKSHQFSHDVQVKVTKVSFPHAKVELVKPYCFQPNDLGTLPKNPKQRGNTEAAIIAFLSEPDCEIFLQELVPVNDGTGDLDDIAETLELCRFFYSYLWHETDDGYDTDYYWATTHLEPRLKVYYDIKNNNAARTQVSEPYNRAMKAYHKKLWKYKILRQKYDKDEEAEEEGKPRQMTKKEEQDQVKCWREVCKSEQILDRITKHHNRPRKMWVLVGPGGDMGDLDMDFL